MKRVKKGILIVLFFFSILPVVFGQEVELNVIAPATGDAVDFLLKRAHQFEEKTGVRVNVVTMPYGRDYHAKVMASFLAGGSQYDVLWMDCIDVARYVEAGWVLPIDEYVTSEMKEDLPPAAAEAVSYKGHWYGLPWDSAWKSFFYNVEMLRQIGYESQPKTWIEFTNVSRKLQDADIIKYATGMRNNMVPPLIII